MSFLSGLMHGDLDWGALTADPWGTAAGVGAAAAAIAAPFTFGATAPLAAELGGVALGGEALAGFAGAEGAAGLFGGIGADALASGTAAGAADWGLFGGLGLEGALGGADLSYLGLGGTESLFGGAGAESLFGGLGANVGDTLGGLNIPGWEATGGPMNPGGWSAGSLPGDLATMNTSMLGPGDAGANLWQIPSGAPADLFGSTGTEAGSLIGSSAPTGTTELGALTGGGPTTGPGGLTLAPG